MTARPTQQASTPSAAMSRLTFGDDLTAASDHAWDWVTAQLWPDWRADVLRPIAPTDAPAEPLPPRAAPLRCGFASVRTITTPLEARVALTSHTGSDLLVVGATAWAANQQKTLGGTVDWLARHCEVPVVVARGRGPVHSVLACVDDSSASLSMVDALLALPFAERAAVTVLTVTGIDGDQAAQPQRVVDLLVAGGLRAHLKVVEPDAVIATSGPAFRILQVVERTRPDLVAIGGPARSLFARVRALRGSVAMEVARQAPCSVLLAR